MGRNRYGRFQDPANHWGIAWGGILTRLSVLFLSLRGAHVGVRGRYRRPLRRNLLPFYLYGNRARPDYAHGHSRGQLHLLGIQRRLLRHGALYGGSFDCESVRNGYVHSAPSERNHLQPAAALVPAVPTLVWSCRHRVSRGKTHVHTSGDTAGTRAQCHLLYFTHFA